MATQTLPIPTDAGARDALVERVRALAALRHPCVEPVVAVDVRDDGTLAVRRGGAATDLPTVLAVRGRLTSREAAGVLVAVARGLAALHSAGLRQGSVGAHDVVLDPGGGALLRPRADAGDVCGAGAVASDAAEAEAADVHALATLVADLLGDRSDDDAAGLRAVLAPAAAPDARVRPEAGTLAAQADAAVAAEPVRLPEPAALAAAALGRRSAVPAAEEAPARASRRRAVRRADGSRAGRPASRSARRATAPRRAGTARRVLGLAGAAAAVAVLTAVAVQVGAPDDGADRTAATGVASVGVSPAASPLPVGDDIPETDRSATQGDAVQADPTRDRADPGAAAAELTRRRVALIADPDADPARWGTVDVPGSPAHEADVALLEDAQARTRVRGAEARVEDARPEMTDEDGSGVPRDGGAADVVVRYAVTAHEQVAADGTVTAVPATDVRTATLRLAWTPDGWRVAEVS
ncbi:hypothetical protein ACFQ8T_03570 [Isoptericola sp. NPDC056618]|uniref:hypothetical protein n=1 Tax=Isoptericola sp. NPDC056618 TaxID=3345878 RepID=UPI00368685A4